MINSATRHAPLIALDLELLGRRLLEAVPGLLSWGTLITLGILAVVWPFAIAVFLILYDLYWLIRALYVGAHLVASYRTLRRMQRYDWHERLVQLENRATAHNVAAEAILRLRDKARSKDHFDRARISAALWREEHFMSDLKTLEEAKASVPLWTDILHVVILPVFQEPLSLLKQSIDALVRAAYPKERIWVVVALEERGGKQVTSIKDELEKCYAGAFGRFMTVIHPDGIPGERQVKSANASYAARAVRRALDLEHIPYERVIVSNFDSDTVASPQYFGALTYTYLVTPDRLRCSYQPLPVYHNNVWEAPAFTRIIAMNATFWQIIQSIRPERLVTYSSHAMPFRALVDVGFWDPTIVSEDSRIFWQAYVRYQGHYRVAPLYVTVSMDVTQGSSLWRSLLHQYRQIRRWAWGIENFPFLVRSFLRSPEIPRRERLRRVFWMLEAWHSWATASILLAVLGWIAILFGGTEFQRTVLAFNLPRITRTLLTIGMVGLILNATLSFLLLPPRPPGVPRRRLFYMVLQWVLTPVTALFLGALPALDAQTRLLFGRYLGFWVTPKVRQTVEQPDVHPLPAST